MKSGESISTVTPQEIFKRFEVALRDYPSSGIPENSDIELIASDVFQNAGYVVAVQAEDRLMFYKWIKIDGQDALGGARYYGGFNFILKGLANDPTTHKTLPYMLETRDGSLFIAHELSAALKTGEAIVCLMLEAKAADLITGISLREWRRRQEWEALDPETRQAIELATLRLRRHCGTCTPNDCYCCRDQTWNKPHQ